MKQTSSALTFLMAQYRAIFKRAYVKGIATAVLLTAGLAAGQAQAAGITWGNTNDTPVDVTISGEQTVSGGADIFAHDLIITGTGNLTVSGSGTRPVVNHNMTLQSGAKLTVNNSGSGIQGTNDITNITEGASNFSSVFDTANTTFSATGSTIDLKERSSIVFVNTTITDSNVTLASGACIGADAGTINRVDGRGQLTLDGGTYNLTNGAQVYGLNVDVLDGTTINTVSGTLTNTNLYAGKDGVLNFAGTLNNVSGGYIMLSAGEVHIQDGANIQNKGILGLGYSGQGVVYIEDGSLINHTDASNHMYAGTDIVMTGGTLTLANTTAGSGSGFIGSSDYQESKFDVDFTATGGEITINRSQIQMNNITLGGDVEVTIGTNIGDVEASYWNDNSLINAEDNEDGKTGVLTIDGATITMNAGSTIMGREVNINAGTITLNGTDNAYDANQSGSAIIRGYGNSGVINLAGGSIALDSATDKGAIRAHNINLTGTELSVVSGGELTIAGGINKTNEGTSGANVVSSGLGAVFSMTGGSINNAGTLNFGVNSGSGVDNQDSVFTIAGGTFTNTGTVNVTNDSTLKFTGTSTAYPTITNSKDIKVLSGGTISTEGYANIGGTAGTIDLASGATATFGGEDVKLYGSLNIDSDATASVTGKVTFYGDATSGDADITGTGDLNIAKTGTLVINDAANSLGLTYTAGADGAVGSFTASGFAGLASGSADAQGIIYLNVENVENLGDTTIASGDLTKFTDALKTTLGSNFKGTIKLDGVKFETVDTGANNTVSFDDVEDALATGVDVGYGNTSVTVSSSSSAVQGPVGQVALTGNAGSSVTVGTKTPLVLQGHENAAGVSQGTALVTVGTGETATVGGAKLQTGSNLQLNTANGTISNITAQDNTGSVSVMAGSNITVVGSNVTAASVRDEVADNVTRGDIGSTGGKINEVVIGGSLDVKDVFATNLNLNQADAAVDANKVTADNATVTGSLTAKSLTTQNAKVAGAVNVEGNINAKITTGDNSGAGVFAVEDTGLVVAKKLEADTATLQGTTQVAEVSAISATFDGGSHTITKSLDVTGTDALVVTNGATLSSAVEGETSSTLAIDAGTGGIRVDGNASVTANEITTAGNVYVGADVTSESAGSTAGAGSLAVNSLNLNGNSLIVDPAFGSKFSFVGVGSFSNNQQEVDAGVLNGNAYALQNAILAIGETDEAAVSELFAQYINSETQSLSADNVGSIVYIAEQLDVATGNKLVADSTASVGADGTFDSTKYGQNDVYIGDHSVLAISVDAASNADAAIKFTDSDAQITASTSGKVVITGDYNSVDSLNLFSDAGGANDTDVTIVGANGLRIETLNGLMYADLTGSVGTLNVENMQVDQDKVASAYTDTSSSVRNSIISYVTGDTDWANQGKPGHDIKESRIHGARVADVNYDGTDYYWRNDDGTNGNALTDEEKANLTYTLNPAYIDQATTPDVPEYLTYEKANNGFLTAIREQVDTRGAAADAAAHMADFAGVAQVALKAGSTTTDAIAGRMGMGAQNSAITFANNGQGAGIWVTPIYVSSDSDGFEAQGVDYGTDINLYGVALGGDYTLANGVRIGAMFNVGSGDADGQGAGSSVTSDFDYYGFGLYVGYSVGQFSVVGDVSYTAVDNDVEANTNIDKLETSLDSSNLSVGVTGSYAFETAAGVTVTPHVGLRYSNIDIDDYSVKGKTYGTVGDYSADSLSVFSIPVGVTIASEFQAGTWSVKPSFDLTLTGNFGDDEAEGTFHWAGVENIDSNLNSEIFDNFTYGASLGIAAQSSFGISLGVAVGYTGSSNVDDFGVNANARFTF